MEQIEQMIIDYDKLEEGNVKHAFFKMRKVLHFNHPFFAEAIDKVYHATINSLANTEQTKHRKLLEEAFILLKEEIKGIPVWYRLE